MRKVWAVVLIIVGLLLGLGGSGEIFFAAARAVSSPWLLAVLATAFVALVTAGLGWLGFRVGGARRARALGLGLGAVASLLYLGATYQLLLKPPAGSSGLAPPGPEVQYWDLPTGSRIAYVKAPAAGEPRPTPVIFVHGGPGAPMLPSYLRMGGRAPLDTLASLGYDVYYYDQLGCGYSSRLDLRHEAPYTVARTVDDLEAIRAAIGAERVILVGWSWGGFFASRYMLRHPERVEKAIFEAPAPLNIRPAEYARNFVPGPPMSSADSLRYARTLRPTLRIAAGRRLAAMNSRAAFALVPDREVDLWWEAQIAEQMRLRQFHASCDSAAELALVPLIVGGRGESGLGFFYGDFLQLDAAELPDVEPELRRIATPTLVLHPQCDMLTWASALDYRRTLPNCRLLPIPGAGHVIWYDQPRLHASIVAAFVTDAPLPIDDYAGEEEPW